MESPLKPRVRKRSQFLYPEDEGSPERVGDGGGSSSAPAKKKRPRQQLPPGTPPPPRLHAPLSPVQSQTLNGGAIQSLEERIVAGMPAFAKEGGVALLVVNLRLAAEQYGGGEFDTRLRVPKSVILRDDLIAVLGKILDRPDWLTRWAGTVISFAPPPASREKCNHWAAPKPVPDCLPKSEPPNDGCTYHDALGKGHAYGFGAAYAAADHQLMVLARDRVPGIVQKLNSDRSDDKLTPLRGRSLLDYIVERALGHRGMVAGLVFYLGGRQLAELLSKASGVAVSHFGDAPCHGGCPAGLGCVHRAAYDAKLEALIVKPCEELLGGWFYSAAFRPGASDDWCAHLVDSLILNCPPPSL